MKILKSTIYCVVCFVIAGCESLVPSNSASSNLVPMASNGQPLSTYARFVPERDDDFAWENDVIAFRAYGPALRNSQVNSGVDCWLKRVDYPVIDKWYRLALTENKSYHQDHGEGLDNYHVGSSAGCGSTALWLNNTRQSLQTYTHWKIITSTPKQTVFELHYQHEIDGATYKEVKQISIELGKHLYRVESTFFKNGQLAPNLAIALGLSTHDGKAKVEVNKQQGWLAAWEALDDSELGTGIKLDPEFISDYHLIADQGIKDTGHAIFVTHTNQQGQLVYYAGYGWKKAQHITSRRQWHDYLSTFSLN